MTVRCRYQPKAFFMLLSSILLISCSEDLDTAYDTSDPIRITAPISKSFGRLEIRVDPRIELINIVADAKSYKEKQEREPTMRQKIQNYFCHHKEHPAVNMMQILQDKGFSYERPRWFILNCTNPPELGHPYSLNEIYPYKGWIPDNQTLYELTQKLRDFYDDVKFGTFYYEHQAFYEELLDIVSEGFRDRDYVKILEDYFGEKRDSYILIYSPLSQGGCGIMTKKDGKTTIYSVMSHGDVFLNLHEFAHSFVNPISDDFIEEISRHQNLYYRILQDLPNCYDSWYTAVNEHIIRAFTARVEAMLNGDEAGKKALDRELANGFGYIVPIYDLLEEYESSRDKYPDFRSFYPRIIGLFDEL